MAEFDPYHRWLSIPSSERPISHYRLLGTALFEDDLEVIANAADRQMAHVRTFQSGQYSDFSQRVLNELSAAKLELLNAEKKAAYDARLRAALNPSTPPMMAIQPTPIAPSMPMSMPMQPMPLQPLPFTSYAARPVEMARPVVEPRDVPLIVKRSRFAGWTWPLAAAGGLAVLAAVVVANWPRGVSQTPVIAAVDPAATVPTVPAPTVPPPTLPPPIAPPPAIQPALPPAKLVADAGQPPKQLPPVGPPSRPAPPGGVPMKLQPPQTAPVPPEPVKPPEPQPPPQPKPVDPQELIRSWLAMSPGKIIEMKRRFPGHAMSDLAFSADFHQVAMNRWPDCMDVYALEPGSKRPALQHGTTSGRFLVVAPQGSLWVAGGRGNDVTLIDRRGKISWKHLRGHTGPVLGVDMARDGSWAISASLDGTVRTWDLDNLKPKSVYKGHEAAVWCVALHPNGRQAVSGGGGGQPPSDCALRVWELASGNVVLKLEGHTDVVHRVLIAPDGKSAVTASRDGTVRRWNLATGAETLKYASHPGPMWGVAISPDQKCVAAGGQDGMLRVWDYETGQELHRYLEPLPFTCMQFLGDRRLLATGQNDMQFILWRLPDDPAPELHPELRLEAIPGDLFPVPTK